MILAAEHFSLGWKARKCGRQSMGNTDYVFVHFPFLPQAISTLLEERGQDRPHLV